ncbi:hypothetical protein LY78DRAFT_413959 [Colletotrichum sublineola]|nr:hypothetical protein LY78DRAFT_413959 [Colletotrichum sublineola]
MNRQFLYFASDTQGLNHDSIVFWSSSHDDRHVLLIYCILPASVFGGGASLCLVREFRFHQQESPFPARLSKDETLVIKRLLGRVVFAHTALSPSRCMPTQKSPKGTVVQ